MKDLSGADEDRRKILIVAGVAAVAVLSAFVLFSIFGQDDVVSSRGFNAEVSGGSPVRPAKPRSEPASSLDATAPIARAEPAKSIPASAPSRIFKWVWIPGGSFTMGADAPLAGPRHKVVIKRFQMAEAAVTNKQYGACVAAGACSAAHDSDGTCIVFGGIRWWPGILPAAFKGDDQPVVCVSLEQARTFSKWVGGRLPSEAEWEYAALSAGRNQKYPWGNEAPSCARAVLATRNDGLGDPRYACGRNTTWPVCSKPAGNTRQGLCDMAGNADEWVQDEFHGYSYEGAPVDGSAWESLGESPSTRGSSWATIFPDAWTARRSAERRGTWADRLGFRPAR